MLFLFVGLLGLNVYSKSFESITLEGYDKESLSAKQIRFISKKNPNQVIHLQVDKYDLVNLWDQKTLEKDVESMLKTRKTIYETFGFSEVNFTGYSLDKIAHNISRLQVLGNYVKLNQKKVYFSETNIYYQKNFIQIKILNESMKISKDDIEKIFKQIEPLELEMKNI